MLPNSGVILACLELGKERREYADSLQNLRGAQHVLRYLDAQGQDGSHHEGTRYGSFTNKEVLFAALAMQSEGDDRLAQHPHLKNFGHWLVHLLQPGGYNVNFFDGPDRKIDVRHEPGEVKLFSQSPTHGQTVLDCLTLCALLGQEEPQCPDLKRDSQTSTRPRSVLSICNRSMRAAHRGFRQPTPRFPTVRW